MPTTDVEFSDDVFVITKETAEAYLQTRKGSVSSPLPAAPVAAPAPEPATTESKPVESQPKPVTAWKSLTWTGEVPPQKWMNFYTKVLSKFSSGAGLKLRVTAEIEPEAGVSPQKSEETRSALRELGLSDDIDLK